jgi:hypothetical protein
MAAAVHAIATDLPMAVYVAGKFKKFGEKGQVAALLNILPEFGDSGLDPAVAHIVISGERASSNPDQARLADAAAQAIARFIDCREGAGAHFDARFSWVPYASLLAVSHPAMRYLETVHPVTRKSIPFPDRYISMALKESVAVGDLASGQWARSGLLPALVRTREQHQAHPLLLPVSLDTIRDAALRSLAAASEVPAEPAPAAA